MGVVMARFRHMLRGYENVGTSIINAFTLNVYTDLSKYNLVLGYTYMKHTKVMLKPLI